jgi:diguanylate cyclase (GGDEF)-like protein/PAS domain S-box-containing protein
MIDGKGQVEFCNEAAGRMFDWPTEDIIGHNISRLMPETHAVKHDDYLERYQRTGNQFVLGATREMQGKRRDGTHFPMELSVSEAWIGDRRVFTGFLRDISLRKQIEVRIHHQAVHDDLTGLPNRRMLLTELDSIIQRARDGRHVGILAVVDLDHFMMLNDVMGHLVGDKVLRSIATRLKDRARAGDLVARLDGDEFAIVIDNLGQDEDQAIALATERVDGIQDTIREPLSISDGIYTLTASIGIAVYPRGSQEAQDLLKQADIAKNRAKKTGRDTVRFYRKSMEIESQRRMLVVQELRRGLTNEEFVLHYQPKVDVFSGRLAGLEALIRWQHPVRGLLLPNEFIGHAEENGLISELGWWTMGQVLKDIRDLDMKGFASTVPHIAINVSPVHFYARDFLSRLIKLVKNAGVAADRLELEITENLLLDNIDLAVAKMQNLRDTGISIALDDFGTGYSSLSYFQKLPVDRIKIDRSFVRYVDKQSDQAAMVRAMLSLAKVKPVRFVAEGVETQGEFAWLRDHGCQDVQGFFFCRPIPMDDLIAFARHFQTDDSRGVGGAA